MKKLLYTIIIFVISSFLLPGSAQSAAFQQLIVPRTNIGAPALIQSGQNYSVDPNYYTTWKHTNSLTTVEADLKDMAAKIQTNGKANVRLGFNAEVLYLDQPVEDAIKTIDGYFNLARQYDMPVVLQMTDVIWWGKRPDLWNWFDRAKPGYNPANIDNVEWSCFDKSCASKDTWRYWLMWIHNGFPAPNYESAVVRADIAARIKQLAPTILRNIVTLQQEGKGYLFGGVQVGGETQYWHWTNEINGSLAIFGYRSYMNVICPRSSLICKSGSTRPSDWDSVLARVFQQFDEFLARTWFEAGLAKDQIYSHGGDVSTSFNNYSLPAWSFYGDSTSTVQAVSSALAGHGNPSWGAGEHNPLVYGTPGWTTSLNNLLKNSSVPNAKMIAISNWSSPNVSGDEGALTAIRNILGLFAPTITKTWVNTAYEPWVVAVWGQNLSSSIKAQMFDVDGTTRWGDDIPTGLSGDSTWLSFQLPADYPPSSKCNLYFPTCAVFVRLLDTKTNLLSNTVSFVLPLITPTVTPSPTPTPTPTIPGDLDKNNKVDIFDYNLLIQNFGNTTCGNVADIDGNCKVDIFDYNTLVQNFGKTQ